MQVATGFKAGGELGDERCLNQPAFVVSFFVPWVGKENVHAVQSTFGVGRVSDRQHVVDDFHRVMRNDADIAQTLLTNAFEQSAHARVMHFTA